MWLEREVKPKIVVVGVHNQTETLGRRVVPSKNCVMENHRGSAGEWPAGKGKKINTSYYVPGRDFTEVDIKIHHYPMSK